VDNGLETEAGVNSVEVEEEMQETMAEAVEIVPVAGESAEETPNGDGLEQTEVEVEESGVEVEETVAAVEPVVEDVVIEKAAEDTDFWA